MCCSLPPPPQTPCSAVPEIKFILKNLIFVESFITVVLCTNGQIDGDNSRWQPPETLNKLYAVVISLMVLGFFCLNGYYRKEKE